MASLPERLRDIEKDLGKSDACDQTSKTLIDRYRRSNPDGSPEHPVISGRVLDRVISGETTFEIELKRAGDDFVFLRQPGNLAIFFGNLNLSSDVQYLDAKIKKLYY